MKNKVNRNPKTELQNLTSCITKYSKTEPLAPIKLDIVKAMWYNVSKVVKESRATKTRPVQFINTCLCFGVIGESNE